MRPTAALHLVGTAVLTGALVIQVFLAGLGVFDDPATFLTHRDFGYLIGMLALAVLVLAIVARPGRAGVGLAALVLGLVAMQSVLVLARDTAPAIAALHPLNGFLILGLSVIALRMAWVRVRTAVDRSVTVPAGGAA